LFCSCLLQSAYKPTVKHAAKTALERNVRVVQAQQLAGLSQNVTVRKPINKPVLSSSLVTPLTPKLGASAGKPDEDLKKFTSPVSAASSSNKAALNSDTGKETNTSALLLEIERLNQIVKAQLEKEAKEKEELMDDADTENLINGSETVKLKGKNICILMFCCHCLT